jgi:hypothetical protein
LLETKEKVEPLQTEAAQEIFSDDTMQITARSLLMVPISKGKQYYGNNVC